MASSDSEDEPGPTPDPMAWFDELFGRAAASEPFDPARAALATTTHGGAPDVRFVLARRAGHEGFAFYTSYESPKAAQLAHTPRAALAFHWASLGFQVRVRGSVSRMSSASSDAYFAGRPRGSQLAAWASRQSQPIDSRAELERRVADVERRFGPAEAVPRPEHWGGYLLTAEEIELWRTRDNRLHDRWLFVRDGDGWHMHRLQP